MARQLSVQAQVAKIIRKELKKHGIKAKVRSDSGAMMTAVNINLEDEPPYVVKAVEDFAKKYKYGHFDSMQDMYIANNSKEEIPQVKYISVNVNYSRELKQQALDSITDYFGKPRMNLNEVNGVTKIEDIYLNNLIYQVLRGSKVGVATFIRFWEKPKVQATATLA